MKRKRKINKWLLAYRIAAGLIFLGTVFYSLSFRMNNNDQVADLILTWLFMVYGGYYIVSSYIFLTKG